MRKSLFSRGRGASGEGSEPEYWLSYSDLMAGLLMVFVLMLMATLVYTAQEREELACKVRTYDEVAGTLLGMLDERRRIVMDLRERLDSIDIKVDTTTGTVTFGEGLLFGQASAEVSTEGRTQLTDFAGRYFPILLDNPEFSSKLKRIVVEGHTNSDGPPNRSYEYNLALSHDRALAVMLALLEAEERLDLDVSVGEEGLTYRSFLENRVTANGRSYADRIMRDGKEDKEASRRIEIRLQMDDGPIMDQVLNLEFSECEQ